MTLVSIETVETSLATCQMTKPNYIHINTGSNRRERRHGYTKTGKHYIIPKEFREHTTNTPYKK
jgi:hypothetical protein